MLDRNDQAVGTNNNTFQQQKTKERWLKEGIDHYNYKRYKVTT